MVHTVYSRSRTDPGFFSCSSGHETAGKSEQHATESAIMAAEIEQLPDRAGFLKFPSTSAWTRVRFPIYELPKVAEPFVPVHADAALHA